jgi:acetyl esterase/lipase
MATEQRRSTFWLAIGAVCLAAGTSRADEVEASFGQTYLERASGPLKADVYSPRGEGPFPGVLVVHGGAWRMGTRGQLAGVAHKLAKSGFVAVAISYRLAPVYKFPAQIDDCKAAVRWMRTSAQQLKIDPERIGGFGYSAGAHLVTLLGTTDAEDGLEGIADPARAPSTRLQAVAAGGAPCDFRPLPEDIEGLAFWLGGSRAKVPEQYRLASPATFVTPDDPPMFFFHGENDNLVPLISPQLMHNALTRAGVTADLYVVPRLGHIASCVDREAIDRSIAFLGQHLKPQATP